MRFGVFIAALLLALPVAAQQAPVKKKPAATKKPAAAKKAGHRKPTPEQIRKFNELEKKQKP